MFLILGLGNPGAQYELTRHNVGFKALDALTEKHKIKLDKHRYHCAFGEGKINGLEVVAAKPMTFMNESGKAAKAILSALDILPQGMIVIHDDIDLSLGQIKKKYKGGDAGQLGVRSIMDRFQTDRFTRIRIGVDRPENREDIVDFVLSPFTEEDFPTLNGVLEKAVEMIEAALEEFNIQTNKSEEDTGC
ncbi:MAG: aminoacyl-tRNA hydrolase [Nitrospinota bacterium]|nr:aminoacyl-tRNA hydrolase [Nitrospinota bacterium]